MNLARRLQPTLDLRDREAAEELAAGASLEAILDKHLRAIEAAVNTDLLTSVLLYESEGRRLLHGAAPSLPKAFCDAIHGAEIGPAVGSCGTAAHRRCAVYVTDIATDPLWEHFRHLALPHGLRACWSTPIENSQGELLGTFAIYHLTPRGPTSEELAAVRLITSHVADAIAASRRARVGESRAAAASTGSSVIDLDRWNKPSSVAQKAEPSIWQAMQQIERCRHLAQVAAGRGAEGSPAFQREMREVAQEWRRLALEYEKLFERWL
jgi:GAF domain-containing protein